MLKVIGCSGFSLGCHGEMYLPSNKDETTIWIGIFLYFMMASLAQKPV